MGRELCTLQDAFDQGSPAVTALGANLVAVPTRNGNAVLFDASTGERQGLLPGNRSPLLALRFSAHQTWLAGLTTKELLVWHVPSQTLHGRLERTSNMFDRLRFLDEDSLLILGAHTPTLVLPLDPRPLLESLGTRELRAEELRHFGLDLR